MSLIPNPRLHHLARQILEGSLAQGYTDPELLLVMTFLQDHLLKDDRPLRAIVGSIVQTEEAEQRARFLHDLIGLCGASASIH